MYNTGGGRSDAPELIFDKVEEKVLSICSNITGLEARHDSDSISLSFPVEEHVEDSSASVETTEKQINCLEIPKAQKTASKDNIETPDKNGSVSLEIIDNSDSEKEKKWEKWRPKALKSKMSKVLKPGVCNEASVTSKLDKLSEVRLELVNLQMQTTREQHTFVEKEHNLKMLHLANEERRKEEIHKLLLEKIKLDLRQTQ